jgi:hypothetical protein
MTEFKVGVDLKQERLKQLEGKREKAQHELYRSVLDLNRLRNIEGHDLAELRKYSFAQDQNLGYFANLGSIETNSGKAAVAMDGSRINTTETTGRGLSDKKILLNLFRRWLWPVHLPQFHRA